MFLFYRDNFWAICFPHFLISFILLAVGESSPSAATASHCDEPGVIPKLHLGSTTGLTHPVSPRIALFIQLLIRKAKENPKIKHISPGESQCRREGRDNYLHSWRKSKRSLTWRNREIGKLWIFFIFADICVGGFSVFCFLLKGEDAQPWGSFFRTAWACKAWEALSH